LSEGKKPIVSNTFGDVNTTLLAISNKSSDIAWIDSPVASYNASKFPDRYKVVFYDYIAPYGVGFASDEDGKKLAYAFQAAFLDLQKDGTYESLVSKWGLPKQDSLPSFPINGGR
jgi:polar amino acid transport system substrate-binding protein